MERGRVGAGGWTLDAHLEAPSTTVDFTGAAAYKTAGRRGAVQSSSSVGFKCTAAPPRPRSRPEDSSFCPRAVASAISVATSTSASWSSRARYRTKSLDSSPKMAPTLVIDYDVSWV